MKRVFLPLAAVLIATAWLAAGCGGAEVTPNPTTTGTPAENLITVNELKAKVDAGANIVIVDTRSARAYNKSHIPDAIVIPLQVLLDEDDNPLPAEEISQQFSYLNDYEEIITYCA
jgi:3-mercaptopyruvate sulfurtransferase SseA